jgi:hypothetical protein
VKSLYIVFVLFSILEFSSIASVQRGEFKMPIKKDVWKGIVPINFKGKITNSQTGEGIKTFSVCEIVNGVPQKGKLESGGRTVDFGPQTIQTTDGDYRFTLYLATLNGQTFIRDSKQIRVLGLPSETTIIQINAEGYENKDILIQRDKILEGEENLLDITLNPLEKNR